MSGINRLLVCSLLFLLQGISAQQIKNFSSIAGKKDIPITCLVQNKEGLLFLGSKEGLSKFNGKSSVLFKKEDGLCNNEISSLFFDSKGKLWIGHKNGRISTFLHNRFDSVPLYSNSPDKAITSFFEDKNNTLFIGTYGSGLFEYNGKKLKKYSTENGLSDDLVYSMAYDGKNSLWLGTDAGITKVDLESRDSIKKFSYITTKTGLPDNIVRVVKFDGQSDMLIAMQDSGLCFYNIDKQALIKPPFLGSWTLGAITDVLGSPANSILIATEKKGVLSIEGRKLNLIDTQDGLLSNSISKLFIDREKDLWVAGKSGISLLYNQRHLLLNAALTGMPSDKIMTVFVDPDQTVWAWSNKGLSEILQDAIGDYKVRNLMLDIAAKGTQVVCMIRADQNSIWLGTYGMGIAVLDPKTGKSEFINSKNGLANESISSMCLDKEGFVWASTLGGGVSKINLKTKEIKNYGESNGLVSNYVYQVFRDSKQKIWAAVDGGAIELLEGENFVCKKSAWKLNSKTVFSITDDSKGNIWFVTSDEGLGRFDGNSVSFYTAKNGLRDPLPPILTSVKNKIILVHNKGIDVIDEDRKPAIAYYDISESDLDPNLNGFYNDASGNTWFGTNKGIIKFRACSIASDSISPAAYLTGINIQYNKYKIDSARDFSYKQNNLVFEYAATCLKTPDKLRFRYKLIGLEKDWQYSTEGRLATYNNISPGEYEFSVEACNDEGIWGEPANYKFSISAPVWYHWWFWLIVILILGSGIILFVQYRLKALQKENLVLEQKVTDRTSEIVKQKKVIEEKNHVVEEKQKEILDSIHYAKRIQQALLKEEEHVSKDLPEHFILYLPKDIVAGDFYWAARKQDTWYVAAADCTGHGVPGAMMSMLGMAFLNEINSGNTLLKPAEILNELRHRIITELGQTGKSGESQDGMDISLCSINLKTLSCEWAGANNPLWIIREGKIIEYKADKQPIGYFPEQKPFTNNTPDLRKGDTIYMYTDGFADQFGGPKGKKYLYKQLERLILSANSDPLAKQKEALNDSFQTWKGNLEQVDDVCVIGIKIA